MPGIRLETVHPLPGYSPTETQPCAKMHLNAAPQSIVRVVPPGQSILTILAMNTLHIVCQLLISFGILNVWLLRFRRSSPYRGGNATDMKQEFALYGLPSWSVWLVGGLKVIAAVLLLVGIVLPDLVRPAAIVIALLMTGAIVMHFKIGDPPKKALPASIMLLLSLVLILT